MASSYTSGSITAVSDIITYSPVPGSIECEISGTWVGTLVFVHSRDGSLSDIVTYGTYTSNPASVIEVSCPMGQGVYAVIASAWTSGTATVRLGNV